MNLDSIMIHKNVDRVSSKFNRLKTAFIMIHEKEIRSTTMIQNND